MGNFKLCVSLKSDLGIVRKNNEDYVGYYKPHEKDKIEKYGSIFVVADGVGGNVKGEVASKLAVETIIEFYYKQPLELSPDKRLKNAIEKANEIVLNKSYELGAHGMATTVVCAVIIGNCAYIGNVGDSRAYIINKKRINKIKQITFDHSLVAEQVRRGVLNEEEAKNASNKNIITRAVGMDYSIQVDLFKVKLIPGDKLLLCSDGLIRVVEDKEIFNIVTSNSVENSTQQLINLANKRGGPDNITVCLVGIEEAKIKALSVALPISLIVFLIFVLGVFFLPKLINKKINISISSTPQGAEVYIDDIKIGITPIENYAIKIGEHKITLNENSTTTISKSLTPLTGTLQITSNPSGAKVYINDEYKGTTPLDFTLPPGSYNITLTKEGYEDYTIISTIQSNKTTTINANLKKKSTAGTLIWRYKTGDGVYSSPTIYNGKLYVGSFDNYIYCLDIGEP
jgi:protein phosphatase